MTDLTKDFKDGKGIFHHQYSGYVYVKDTLGNEVIESLAALYQTPFSLRKSKISKGYKILAEVPDYTAWQNLWNTADMEHKANNKLIEDVERLEKENKELKKQVNHLSKKQAQQFVDNQKLQVKAEKAKDVVDITTAKKIKQFKELLKDLQSEAIDALTAIQNDCESDDFSIFDYPEVQTFYTLSEKIDEEL